MSAWEYRQIDEDGGMGWARPLPDGYLFAWGAGIEQGEPHPGGWSWWLDDESGDLDLLVEHVTDWTWDADAAKAAADEGAAAVPK